MRLDIFLQLLNNEPKSMTRHTAPMYFIGHDCILYSSALKCSVNERAIT